MSDRFFDGLYRFFRHVFNIVISIVIVLFLFGFVLVILSIVAYVLFRLFNLESEGIVIY